MFPSFTITILSLILTPKFAVFYGSFSPVTSTLNFVVYVHGLFISHRTSSPYLTHLWTSLLSTTGIEKNVNTLLLLMEVVSTDVALRVLDTDTKEWTTLLNCPHSQFLKLVHSTERQ